MLINYRLLKRSSLSEFSKQSFQKSSSHKAVFSIQSFHKTNLKITDKYNLYSINIVHVFVHELKLETYCKQWMLSGNEVSCTGSELVYSLSASHFWKYNYFASKICPCYLRMDVYFRNFSLHGSLISITSHAGYGYKYACVVKLCESSFKKQLPFIAVGWNKEGYWCTW